MRVGRRGRLGAHPRTLYGTHFSQSRLYRGAHPERQVKRTCGNSAPSAPPYHHCASSESPLCFACSGPLAYHFRAEEVMSPIVQSRMSKLLCPSAERRRQSEGCTAVREIPKAFTRRVHLVANIGSDLSLCSRVLDSLTSCVSSWRRRNLNLQPRHRLMGKTTWWPATSLPPPTESVTEGGKSYTVLLGM